MYVVGVGLIKVYKALLRLARGALFVPFLMSMSEAFSVSFLYLIQLCYTKALEWASLVPGPKAKSSSEVRNPTSFTTSYQLWLMPCQIGSNLRPGLDMKSPLWKLDQNSWKLTQALVIFKTLRFENHFQYSCRIENRSLIGGKGAEPECRAE